MRWDPPKEHIPCRFPGAMEALTDVELALLFAEPGDPQSDEVYSRLESAALRALLPWAPAGPVPPRSRGRPAPAKIPRCDAHHARVLCTPGRPIGPQHGARGIYAASTSSVSSGVDDASAAAPCKENETTNSLATMSNLVASLKSMSASVEISSLALTRNSS